MTYNKISTESYVLTILQNINQYPYETINQIRENSVYWSKLNIKDVFTQKFGFISRNNIYIRRNYIAGKFLLEYI